MKKPSCIVKYDSMNTLIAIIAAYLIGSLSFAVIVSKLMGLPDPHSYGSGNPGATNVLRTGKKLAALLTLLGDAGKGWFALWLAQKYATQFGLNEVALAGVALAVFIGHLYPIFFKFEGGKGVATAAGILFAIHVWLGLGTLATWLIIAVFFRYSSLAALSASLFAPFFTFYMFGATPYLAAVTVMCALLIWRHKENITKLINGTESKLGAKKPSAEAANEATSESTEQKN
jgi:acyl phosphate:glycerol-3-phosphate acyltransferase